LQVCSRVRNVFYGLCVCEFWVMYCDLHVYSISWRELNFLCPVLETLRCTTSCMFKLCADEDMSESCPPWIKKILGYYRQMLTDFQNYVELSNRLAASPFRYVYFEIYVGGHSWEMVPFDRPTCFCSSYIVTISLSSTSNSLSLQYWYKGVVEVIEKWRCSIDHIDFILVSVITIAPSCTIFELFDVQNIVTLTFWFGVVNGITFGRSHASSYSSSMAVSCSVSYSLYYDLYMIPLFFPQNFNTLSETLNSLSADLRDQTFIENILVR